MNHLIRTQVIDVVFYKETEAFALQQQLRDLFYQVILPVLEKAFDELSTPQEVIYLDTLELDLGTVSLRELAALDLTEKLKEKIKEQITAIILSPAKKKKAKRALRLNLVQQWMYYMQHGFLPWNTITTDTAWYEQVLEGFATDSPSIEALRNLVATDARALKRMVLLSTPQFLVHLTEALTSQKQTDLATMLNAIEAAWVEAGKQNESVPFRRKAWEAMLTAAGKALSLTAWEIIRNIILPRLDEDMIMLLQRSNVTPPEMVEQIAAASKALAETSTASAAGVEPSAEAERQPSKIRQSPAVTPTPVPVRFPDDGLFVAHAGLVLLHPFLYNLFGYLGLLEGKDFKTSNHRQKALAVLHFLGTGRVSYEEHELVVPKILCHYPWEELVDPEIKLSVAEQRECDGLLTEMIARWTILKSTSPDTLRTNFLQRGGKLYTLGNEPHLLVESNMLDVLLDHLPWGIGIIKLPWMEQLLKVEWR